MIVSSLLLLVILATGLLSLAKGGEFSRKYSNKLMRYRIYVQGFIIVLFLLILIISTTDS